MLLTKKLLIITIMLFLPFTANAGIGSHALKLGAGYGAYRLATAAITKGGPIALRTGAAALAKYLKANPGKVAVVVGAITTYAIEHPKLTDNAIALLTKSGYLNDNEALRIKEDSIGFAKAYAQVELNVRDIKHKDACRNGMASTYLLSNNSVGYYENVSDPVRLGNVGSYKALNDKAVIGDELEHDHIPSRAAVQAYLEDRLGRKTNTAEGNNIKNNATALEIPKTLHASGRTYRGRNSYVQIAKDAEDLRLATIKDLAWHLYNSGGNMSLLSAFRQVYTRNASLCLFEKNI